MPTKINPDFKPDERSYTNLRKHGVLPDFIEDQLPGFITYWLDTGKKKSSWQMTLQVWMRRAFQGKAGREWEQNRHIRERYQTGPKEDLFEKILNNLDPTSKTVETTTEPKYYLPDPPAPGPAMKPEEAFEQLKKLRLL